MDNYECKIVKPRDAEDELSDCPEVAKLDKKIEELKNNDLAHITSTLNDIQRTLRTHKWLLGLLLLAGLGGEAAYKIFG